MHCREGQAHTQAGGGVAVVLWREEGDGEGLDRGSGAHPQAPTPDPDPAGH